MISRVKGFIGKISFCINAFKNYEEVKFRCDIGDGVIDDAKRIYLDRYEKDKTKPIVVRYGFEWREIAARCENE